MEQILKIFNFILSSLIHIWPYLLISIPLAVGMKFSGASKYLNKSLGKNIYVSIILATLVGAVSPFCSCGVIPVVATLLIGGIPLAPVMSFWIASPSMDPEIFFLSVATIGWKLSVWRLAATFAISLSAGLIAHYAMKKGYLGESILKNDNVCSDCAGTCLCQETQTKKDIAKKLFKETWSAFSMVASFMAIAFFINAIIEFYVPKNFFAGYIGNDSPFAVVISALVGIPVYTSNLTSLPLVGGLLTAGMNPGAVLAFLIAGPVTTIPAMAAVWGIVKPKIFALYIFISLFGAIIFGFLYNFMN
ncbi:MAG: permease [Bacteroidales bacterium]|nr:permease [Bacteroidales bacterium]